jgi:hypothetical protein
MESEGAVPVLRCRPGSNAESSGRGARQPESCLWLALPAAAQFEIDPDHFDYPATNVVQARPDQSKGSMRIPYKQVQRHRAQAFKGQRVHPTRCGRLYLLVENVDRVVAKAVGLGATAQAPVTDTFWATVAGWCSIQMATCGWWAPTGLNPRRRE